ncbi:MAG TPA: FHA domain-containing protein [Thermoanaerobaculia bacterium]|nr:FHA domain-containing protein [Thermoanaerobaculia bacterium]
MIITCDTCLARYRYDETRFAGKRIKKVRCTKCLTVFEVENPAFSPAGPATLRESVEETYIRLSDETGAGKPPESARKRPIVGAGRPAGEPLILPSDAKLSLAVISGPAAGTIYAIEKPRVVIGRQDADFVLEDPEISRHHSAIEVSGERVTLIDLESTNGTFIGEQPIREAPLGHQQEFSIGGSTIMLIVTRP